MKPILAQHWTLDAWDLAPAKLRHTRVLLRFCSRVVKALDMQVLDQPAIYRVDNKGNILGRTNLRREALLKQVSVRDKAWGPGITILIGILDSSITLHTLSQFGRLYLDVFSCKPLSKGLLRKMTVDSFGLKGWPRRNYKTRLIRRG